MHGPDGALDDAFRASAAAVPVGNRNLEGLGLIDGFEGFDEAVEAVTGEVAKAGFRVLHVHDVPATFREKGVQQAPYKIVEVCNVKYAKQALDMNLLIGLMMPCKINLYEESGQTKISLLLPSAMPAFFPGAGLESLADEVEGILRQVIDRAI